jgi:hypothetical protein
MPTSTVHLGIFYMPQICDMGPTALLPFRRKALWGFFQVSKHFIISDAHSTQDAWQMHYVVFMGSVMHTRCSFLWSIVKIATGHVHDSKQTRVKAAHFILPTWNLARWLTRYGSLTMHLCFELPQLLCRWRHQSGKFLDQPMYLHSLSRTFSSVNTIQTWRHR